MLDWIIENMIILDNLILSFASNIDNGIYILSFEGDLEDKELLIIIDFLKEMHDACPYIKDFAGIHQLFSFYQSKC